MKLKPCPFCGKKAHAVTKKNDTDTFTDIGCKTLMCPCWICTDKDCDCEAEGYVLKKDAIKYWNERA